MAPKRPRNLNERKKRIVETLETLINKEPLSQEGKMTGKTCTRFGRKRREKQSFNKHMCLIFKISSLLQTNSEIKNEGAAF